MPLEQGTFSIVPTTLVAASGASRPPMTSKQAKKAYKKATALPKLSKAERRRQEDAEIKALREEQDKERARNRARVLRERKAEKEREQKQERKKNGIPEKSKWVRASQPTITRLITRTLRSATASSTKHIPLDSTSVNRIQHKVSDTHDESEDEPQDEPPRKRRFTSPTSSPLKGSETPISTPVDDELNGFDEFPTLSQSDSLGLSDTRPAKHSSEFAIMEDPKLDLFYKDATTSPPHGSGVYKTSSGKEWLANTQLVGNTTRQIDKPPTPQSVSNSLLEKPGIVANEPPHQEPVPPTLLQLPQRPPLRERSYNMPPPPLPAKALKSKAPRITSTNTQAFLESNCDHFSLSPSQEVKEIMGLVGDYDFPSNTQIALEIVNDQRPAIPTIRGQSKRQSIPDLRRKEPDNEFSFLSTQDLSLSSQDLVEIEAPPRRFTRSTISHTKTLAHASKHPIQEKKVSPPKSLDNEYDVLSTQDCVVSSQDLREINGPINQKFCKTNILRERVKCAQAPRTEAKIVAWEQSVPESLNRGVRPDPVVAMAAETTKSGLQPVKHLTQLASGHLDTSVSLRKQEPLKQKKGRFFEEKEEDIMAFVLEESRKTAARPYPESGFTKHPPQNQPKKVGRRLERVLSTQTDYGELGIDEDDLSTLIEHAEATCSNSLVS